MWKKAGYGRKNLRGQLGFCPERSEYTYSQAVLCLPAHTHTTLTVPSFQIVTAGRRSVWLFQHAARHHLRPERSSNMLGIIHQYINIAGWQRQSLPGATADSTAGQLNGVAAPVCYTHTHTHTHTHVSHITHHTMLHSTARREPFQCGHVDRS